MFLKLTVTNMSGDPDRPCDPEWFNMDWVVNINIPEDGIGGCVLHQHGHGGAPGEVWTVNETPDEIMAMMGKVEA